TMNSRGEIKGPQKGNRSHKDLPVVPWSIVDKPHPGFAAGPMEHCRPPRVQNLQALLLWGDDSKAVVFCATQGRGESAPQRRSRDRFRNLSPNSRLVYSNHAPA